MAANPPDPKQRPASPWLLLMFSLPSKRASERVGVWRRLRKYGTLALRASGYLLPNTPENHERFEWLAAAVRKYKGQASVARLEAIDNMPSDKLRQMFLDARARDYETLMRDLRKLTARKSKASGEVGRYRRRLQEIAAIDFFGSPLRSRAQALLESADPVRMGKTAFDTGRKARKQYLRRVWVTRPRPGIDRVSSAWLIRRFIDRNARFAFADDPARHPGAVPFDMFHGGGFGHRGDDCTFETLRAEFAIRERKVGMIAEIIHDADLADEKFGRSEGLGLDRVLIGWAQHGISDEALLRRGMEMIEGLYQSLA